jgi:Na+(H+)/acetate symporter ActP
MKREALIATVLILIRQIVATLHGLAHQQLGVGLNLWQQTFVLIVITIAPLVAMALYWTRYARQGALLLWTSMLAGMLFGIYHHFIAVSTDHVSHLPEGDAQGFFIATAVLLIPAEIVATGFGFWSWLKLRGAAK